jgi:hypothetical protein
MNNNDNIQQTDKKLCLIIGVDGVLANTAYAWEQFTGEGQSGPATLRSYLHFTHVASLYPSFLEETPVVAYSHELIRLIRELQVSRLYFTSVADGSLSTSNWCKWLVDRFNIFAPLLHCSTLTLPYDIASTTRSVLLADPTRVPRECVKEFLAAGGEFFPYNDRTTGSWAERRSKLMELVGCDSKVRVRV